MQSNNKTTEIYNWIEPLEKAPHGLYSDYDLHDLRSNGTDPIRWQILDKITPPPKKENR